MSLKRSLWVLQRFNRDPLTPTLTPLSHSLVLSCPLPPPQGSVPSADSALLDTMKEFLKLFCNYSRSIKINKRTKGQKTATNLDILITRENLKYVVFSCASFFFFFYQDYFSGFPALLFWEREGKDTVSTEKFWKFPASVKGEGCYGKLGQLCQHSLTKKQLPSQYHWCSVYRNIKPCGKQRDKGTSWKKCLTSLR